MYLWSANWLPQPPKLPNPVYGSVTVSSRRGKPDSSKRGFFKTLNSSPTTALTLTVVGPTQSGTCRNIWKVEALETQALSQGWLKRYNRWEFDLEYQSVNSTLWWMVYIYFWKCVLYIKWLLRFSIFKRKSFINPMNLWWMA